MNPATITVTAALIAVLALMWDAMQQRERLRLVRSQLLKLENEHRVAKILFKNEIDKGVEVLRRAESDRKTLEQLTEFSSMVSEILGNGMYLELSCQDRLLIYATVGKANGPSWTFVDKTPKEAIEMAYNAMKTDCEQAVS